MPAVRKMLMSSDREEISRGLAEGLQFKEIAHRLDRDLSVISREVSRHGGPVTGPPPRTSRHRRRGSDPRSWRSSGRRGCGRW
jgi:IS30 family transposase